MNRKIEEQKQQMNWDQQALENWVEECKRRDENVAFLEKYSRQDEAKIKVRIDCIDNLLIYLLSYHFINLH